VRKILRLLYHVVAHIYHCHFREVALLGLHAHLNCVFAHLTLLNQRFNLIDPKETEILGDLEAALLGKLLYAIAATDAVLIDADYAMPARDPETGLRFSCDGIFPSKRSIGPRVRLGKLPYYCHFLLNAINVGQA